MRIVGEVTRDPAGRCAKCKYPLQLHDQVAVTVSGTDVLGGVVARMQHAPACPRDSTKPPVSLQSGPDNASSVA